MTTPHGLAEASGREPIVWFLFLGGVAAGAHLLGSLAMLAGRVDDRRVVQSAHYVSFPLLTLCAMLVRMSPILRHADVSYWFALAVLSGGLFLFALAEDLGWTPRGWVSREHGGRSALDLVPAAVGLVVAALAGASIAGLSTAWCRSGVLRVVLLTSSVTTGAAALALMVRARHGGPDDPALAQLGRVDGVATVVQLAALTVLTLTLAKPSGLAFQRWPGMLIPLFVVPVGLVLPLTLRQAHGPARGVPSAVLELAGGFGLRLALAGIPASLLS